MRHEQTASEKERPQPRRKIEQQLIQAIKEGQNWQNGNTQATRNMVGGFNIYLHGNLLALQDMKPVVDEHEDIHLETQFKPVLDTFRQWPTRTTVSRLRALGINAAIRKGKPTIDGTEI